MEQDYPQPSSVFTELLHSPLALVSASRGQRFINYLVDLATFYAGMFAIGIGLGIVAVAIDNQAILQVFDGPMGSLVAIFIMLCYYFILESTTGRTMGKLVTRTRVVMADGSKLTTSAVLKRTLCRIIPFEAFSFFNDAASGLHDSISKTRVVKMD
ncbi:RDD family protein [Hymenobacter psychrotolerans]|uniref:Uncharacterized membrane protein YckC, RDD family n=1 Tax=Hymenobacter psychrotolerans DSM 18569 TaxID=1121959 RepID=A0A1M6WJV1_9BACT|nr:RDD family protein [Hymenobacter psychrotolerans]SHK93884.1 Uncharacterized membrane protein YckC, RDD family [Hymenobacter psychrotolerans DSM 18569]